MKDVLLGRGDLVRALRSGGPELQEAVAHFLGLERIPPQVSAAAQTRFKIEGTASAEIITQPTAIAVEVPFWQAYSFRAREPLTVETERADGTDADTKLEQFVPDRMPVEFAPLASGAAILTRLRRDSAFSHSSGNLDLDRIVDQLSRGRLLWRLPRRPRKQWGQSIQVVVDRSRRLAPYWTDQDVAVWELQRVYPCGGFQVAVLPEGASEPWICLPRDHSGPYTMPEPGTNVVVLGDLGCLARDPGYVWQWWLEWGRRFLANGNQPLALVPCHPDRCPPELAETWTIVPWESSERDAGPALSPERTKQVARRILTLLSFALRVEPRMIRAVRRMLPECRWDPGIESIVWQDEAFISRHCDAAAFDPQKVKELRDQLGQVDPDERRKVYGLVARMRQDTYEGVWYAELLGLEDEVANDLLKPWDLRRAVRWFRMWSDRLSQKEEYKDLASDQATWFRRVCAMLPESPYQGIAANTLHKIWTLVNARDEGGRLPDYLDPGRLPTTAEPVRTIALSQVAGRLIARPFLGSGQPPGSMIALMCTRNGWIKIEPEHAFWAGGVPPAWAVDWGRDQFGGWATFQVGSVTQKMRWIPPGKFLMGSPEDEDGRWDNEGPQHQVAIETGFWLFDTPCTQALWEAVMGENPSRFREPTRPVEQVSWDDVQVFLTRMKDLVPGLGLHLPAEAQWEYACRAGTRGARYAADLSEIAWYSENSDGQTHPVGEKRPNGWGLHDMLGNVWEWCADKHSPYGPGEREASADRVLRGGSWSAGARYVRAAYRRRNVPGPRYGSIGFRCAEFSSPGPASGQEGVERAARSSERVAEPRGDDEPASKTRWLDLAGRDEHQVEFPALVSVRVLTDVDQLTLQTLNRPPWASGIGRDRHGLWAELVIEKTVRQRLRWIPPGRFLMGSPEDEPGRYDNEGPQRDVTIERGFWMFDTPCTQELWETVMGENPCEFRSPTRPVEQVSWEDCRSFVDRLNKRLDGLVLSLPSEAQWEYACRAGTPWATYAGNLEILGENNAPVLDGIAWYGGNCGVDFELNNGWGISSWPEKQYEFSRGGTHPVGLKQPNGWGLRDMLGNVWEWCADKYSPYGSGESGASADRVLRGGSWSAGARVVRAASRDWNDPGFRYDDVGFRCAEFREGSVEGQGRAASESERAAEPRGDRESASPGEKAAKAQRNKRRR